MPGLSDFRRRGVRHVMLSAVVALAGAVGAGRPTEAAPSSAELRNLRVVAEIDPVTQGVVDEDSYAGVLMRGETVQAIVRAAAGSALLPSLRLDGPSGQPEPAPVVTSADGRTARIRRHPAAESGVHALAVGGAQGTNGTYEGWFDIRGTRSKDRVGATLDPAATGFEYRFSAVAGARLTFHLRWPAAASPFEFVAVEDPDGAAVAGAATAVRSTARSVDARSFRIAGRPGEYVLKFLRAADGPTDYDLRVVLDTPQRNKRRARISFRDPEPRLAPVPTPVEALEGTNVTFHGDHFSSNAGVVVEIGGQPCTVLSSSATYVDVTVPPGIPGSLVPVTVVNADGQADQRDAYFQYLVPETVPTLTPGTGFVAATPQPPPSGTGPGADAQAIARWDAVPFQTIDRAFDLAVVAFHMSGIDRVEFSVDGGPWAASRKMTRHPATGVWEYVVRVDGAALPDGRHEVRAVAYPTVGEPRVLQGALNAASFDIGEHSMVFHSNAGGTLRTSARWVDGNAGDDTTGDGSEKKPFRSIFKALVSVQTPAGASDHDALDGCTVYLRAGSYAYGRLPIGPRPMNSERYVTVQPAPGTLRQDVVVSTQSDQYGLMVPYVHMKDLSVRGGLDNGAAHNGSRYLWVDSCDFVGNGRISGQMPVYASHWEGVFVTDVTLRSYTNAFIASTLVRGCRYSDLGADAFTNCRTVIDSQTDGIDSTGSAYHPDVYQTYGVVVENLVVYGLRVTNADAQGIFFRGLTLTRDAAFVNVLMARPAGALPHMPMWSQWLSPGEHILFWNVALPNQLFDFGHASQKNISVVGCVFGKLLLSAGPAAVPDSWFRHCHFVDTTTFGASVRGYDRTTGDAGFTDPYGADFRPSATSVLRNRIPTPVVPCDAVGADRTGPDTVGPLR